jgi:glutamate-1-semialdehyde 2,1-aminomutase
MSESESSKLYKRAQRVIPGGVNSPVRAFRAVGGNPLFIQKASGAYLYDEDGNGYVDLINSWGPMILGHAHPAIEEAVRKALEQSPSFGAPTAREVEMAELICELVPSIEMVRMVNSGTEATMSAIRLARGFTTRDKIIKFEGCYHGHGDSFLIAAGSGAMTFGRPDSPGVTAGTAKDTLIVPFNNLGAVKKALDENAGQVAAIILEPVVGNMGCVPPLDGFLEGLRQLCDEHQTLLIFDEVMTGFRLALGGAQERYNIRPDLTTLGKIIGGGLPVGAYGGRADIMSSVSPVGPVYQAGTLSGNPLAMAAGLCMLRLLHEQTELYARLELVTSELISEMLADCRSLGIPASGNQVGSMFTLFFTNQKVVDFASAKTCDTAMFGRYFQAMLKEGVYLAPAQFEAMFISAAITDDLAGRILESHRKALRSL